MTIGAAIAMPVLACSICRCGDPTFNALGKEGVSQTGLRLALDWDQTDKTQGDPADDFDELHEQRLSLCWRPMAFSDRFGVFARLPYSRRELTETAGRRDASTRTPAAWRIRKSTAQARLWSSALRR